MRRRWIRTGILAGLAAVLGLGAAVPAALADERDFTLVNDSSLAIVDLYITHVSEPDWSDNILGEDSLGAGSQVQVLFADPSAGLLQLRRQGHHRDGRERHRQRRQSVRDQRRGIPAVAPYRAYE